MLLNTISTLAIANLDLVNNCQLIRDVNEYQYKIRSNKKFNIVAGKFVLLRTLRSIKYKTKRVKKHG